MNRAVDSFRRWLFRLARDERVPIVLTQRRIFIVPTGAGTLFAVVLAVMLIGAINYNLGLGHALIFLLTGLGCVAMVHTFHNLFGLQLTPGRSEAVFAGETARFPLHVDNQRGQARHALQLSFLGQPTVMLDVPPKDRATSFIPYVTQRRGLLDPGRVTLSSRYPLGLFRAWCYPYPPFACTVYPKPILTPLPKALVSAHASDGTSDGGHDDFAGLRARQISDPTRHIAWKAVARQTEEQPLLVKNFSGGGPEELWLDWSLLPTHRLTEDRLSMLAGWILAADEAETRYGLRLPNCVIAPALGSIHRAHCLQTLALYSFDESRDGG